MEDQPQPHFVPDWDQFVFFVAVLSVVAGLNFKLFEACQTGSLLEVIGISAFFAIEIGVIALFSGYGDHPTWLRWTIMIWMFALVDLQLFALGVEQNNRKILPVVAMFASQYGLVVTWVVMGSTHFIKRITCALGFATLLSIATFGVIDGVWGTILACFLIALLVTLLILRYFGFRMIDVKAPADDDGLQAVQFGLRHALILTTVLAVLMGVLKSQEAQIADSFEGVIQISNVILLALGIASAIGVALACWAALGDGRYLVRYIVLLVGTLIMGVAMTYWFHSVDLQLSARVGVPFTLWEYRIRKLANLQWQWVAWFVLSGIMLVASLAFFRIQGMRFALTHRSKIG